MTDSKEKSLTLKSLKKETDAWKAENKERVDFAVEHVVDLDETMGDVCKAIGSLQEDVKTHSKGIRVIENNVQNICAVKYASESDLQEMQEKMEEVFKKMTRVEKTQIAANEAHMNLVAEQVATADKVTSLKSESHRTTTLLGIVAAVGLGLGLVMTALYMGLV